MELTKRNKDHIDKLSYTSLLDRWRFSPAGDPWFQGETGDYWKQRMQELRKAGVDHVGVSKTIGWEK